MSSSSAKPHLFTTSRINRLLRPLRAKCASLASLCNSRKDQDKPEASSSKTQQKLHGNMKTLQDNAGYRSALALLPPPEALGVVFGSKKAFPDAVELSRRIYGVRNSFKAIIEAAAALETSQVDSKSDQACSLAAMCATVVGHHMHPEIDADIGVDEDGVRVEDEVMDAENALFDAVPLQYRQWTVASYAVAYVLRECPVHHTLLTLLLEICLRYHFLQDACTILRELLSAVLSANTSHSDGPLHTTAHGNYLVDLYTLWIESVEPRSSGLGENDSASIATFTRITVDSLRKNADSRLWTCKAVKRFARLLARDNLGAFLELIMTMADFMLLEQDGDDKMRTRLQNWTTKVLDHLTSLPSPNLSQSYEAHQLVVQLFCYPPVKEVALHDQTLSNTLISLATYCLAECGPHMSSPETSSVIDFLDKLPVNSSSYKDLAGHIFNSVKPFSAQDWQETLMQEFKQYTAALRNHALLLPETCLWSYLLRHLEKLSSPISSGDMHCKPVVADLRLKLMKALDEAERLCYAGKATTQEDRNEETVSSCLDNASAWEYDDFADAWTCRSPQLSRATVEARVIRPPKRVRFSADSGAYADNCPGEKSIVSPMKRCRRLSNFSSILQDTLTNQISVHAQTSLSYQTLASFPSSDDALDLFSYVSSPLSSR